jgi:capsule polysaccharide export protein KpsC/LpsZ
MENENYSAQLVYKPPTNLTDRQMEKVRFIQFDYVVNLREYAEETCPSCDAFDLLRQINDINEKTSLCEDLELLKKAIVFILQNVDWKTSDYDKTE